MRQVLSTGKFLTLEQPAPIDDAARGVLLGNVAAFYQESGRQAEARRLYEKALRLTVASSGDDTEDTANLNANLGDLCLTLGAYEEAEDRLQHALATYRRLGREQFKED